MIMNDRDQIVLLRPRSEAPSLNIPLASRSILWLLPRDAGLSGPMQTLVNIFSSVISAALAYPMSSVCNTMKRERDGNQKLYSRRCSFTWDGSAKKSYLVAASCIAAPSLRLDLAGY